MSQKEYGVTVASTINVTFGRYFTYLNQSLFDGQSFTPEQKVEVAQAMASIDEDATAFDAADAREMHAFFFGPNSNYNPRHRNSANRNNPTSPHQSLAPKSFSPSVVVADVKAYAQKRRSARSETITAFYQKWRSDPWIKEQDPSLQTLQGIYALMLDADKQLDIDGIELMRAFERMLLKLRGKVSFKEVALLMSVYVQAFLKLRQEFHCPIGKGDVAHGTEIYAALLLAAKDVGKDMDFVQKQGLYEMYIFLYRSPSKFEDIDDYASIIEALARVRKKGDKLSDDEKRGRGGAGFKYTSGTAYWLYNLISYKKEVNPAFRGLAEELAVYLEDLQKLGESDAIGNAKRELVPKIINR